MKLHGIITKAKVNSETIKGLDDDQLYDLIFDKASQKDSGTFGEYFQENEKDQLLRQIFATAILDGEVYNGGFDQFFLNYGELADAAAMGLKLIKAKKHLDLLIDAIKTYETHKEQFKNKRNPHLNDLDDKYYDLEEFYDLRMEFIKENVEMFFD